MTMPMALEIVRPTRARLYVLISSFETDIRRILDRYVVEELGEQGALGKLFEKAERRRLDDDVESGSTPLVEYLDLMEGYDLLNTHRKLLPSELAEEVRGQTGQMPRVVEIRNRIMHSRPPKGDDAPSAVRFLEGFQSQWWRELHAVIERLQRDDSWEPAVPRTVDPASTLHNLPAPDFDETGLLGRDKEARQVADLLKRGREPVITITGEGGIGKTALALFVAYLLVDDETSPFDAILWASLKHEKLTATGVKRITGALRDIAGVSRELGAGLDSSFEGSVETLSEALNDIRALLVIDNLETVSGEEFLLLYDRLPDSVSYLVTSRVGIGQLERRYPLLQLEERAAVQLLNEHIRFKRVLPLMRISGDTRKEIVKRLRFSPLGIIWFVLAVEAGREPVSLLKEQDEFLEFCVRSVFEGLSKPARRLLEAMAVLRRPVGPDELAVLTQQPVDAVNQCVQELERGSLVSRSPAGSTDLRLIIEPTETAELFLERRTDRDVDVADTILKRDREFRDSEERRSSEAASRSLAPAVIHSRGPGDAASAYQLRQAYLLAKDSGNIQGALKLVNDARRLNPDFFEVDRIEAFVRVYSSEYSRASSCYEEALEKAQGSDRGIVAHFYASHLSKNMQDHRAALRHAREAAELVPSTETELVLGNILVRNFMFDEAAPLLQKVAATSKGRTRVIAIDAYVTALRRWAEWCGRDERNVLKQFARAREGAEVGLQSLQVGVIDHKLVSSICSCIIVALHGARAAVQSDLEPARLREFLELVARSSAALSQASEWVRVYEMLQSLASVDKRYQKLARQIEALSPTTSSDTPTSEAASSLVGRILSLHDGYAFIEHPRFPSNVFCHHTQWGDEKLRWDQLRVGDTVAFDADMTERGPRARRVSLRSGGSPLSS